MTTWMVRAGQGGAYVDVFLNERCVGVDFGSGAFERPPMDLEHDELAGEIRRARPEASRGNVHTSARQLYRFVHGPETGDAVVTYDPAARVYYIGTIEAAAEWSPGRGNALATRRAVKWTCKAPRDVLSVETRNTLGSIMTLFVVHEEAAEELRRASVSLASSLDDVEVPSTPPVREELSIEDLRWENVEKSHEFIEDVIAKLDPYELQNLMAGILRAMGYKTRVAPPGPDRGVDIFASPDGLGLEEPRIFVEVKQRPATAIGSQDIRAFLGGRKPTDRCLYVSTGGFTKDARYEGDRASMPLTLIDLQGLRELLLAHYEALDAETRQLVPLTRVYWPIQREE